MRVAIDEQIFAIQAYGGISRVFAELARQFVKHVPRQVDLAPLDAPIINRYILEDAGLADALHVREARSEWTALARYLARPRSHPQCDILHNTFYLPHGLVTARGAKRVVTVHDMIPEILPRTRRRLDLLTLKRHYVERADHVICVSEATRRDLERVYGPLKTPVSVVHSGVDARFSPQASRLDRFPDRYILMVGHRGQYKDAPTLFEAFSTVARQILDVTLVCVGGGDWTREERLLQQSLGIASRVQQFQLPDQLMPSAYAGAEVFVFPSRLEGFGLPVLEAMACGTPAVLSNTSSLPEIGGPAAAYFPAGDSAALAKEVLHVLHDASHATALRHRGLERSASFSWARTAEMTADVYAATLNV